MKIKKGFVVQKVGGSYLACATGKLAREFSAVVKLNSTGAFIFEKLSSDDGMDKDTLVTEMVTAFGIDRQLAEKDAEAFIEILSANGILE